MTTLIQQTKIDKKILQRIRRYTDKILEYLNFTDKKVSVILCDENFITEMNSKYFNKNYPTNVISFPFNEELYLGEIYICVEVAKKEAKEWEVSFFYEIIYLIIHGLLHLSGYDHVNNEDEAIEMENKEIEIVNNINLKKWRHNDS